MMKDQQDNGFASPSPMARELKSAIKELDLVGVKMRPSLLSKYIPSVVYFDYPTELPIAVSDRADHSKIEYYAPDRYLLAYKCYWMRSCIKNVFVHNKFKKKTKAFSILWHKHLPDDELKHLECHQKVNHFPSSWCVGRKDRLSRLLSQFKRSQNNYNLNHAKKLFHYHPETFIFPNDMDMFYRYFNSAKSNLLWIVKPVASSCGRGIYVTNTEKLLLKCKSGKTNKANKKLLIQKYIHNPYLINGKKFDLRIYVLVTGVDPLRVYIYEEGLTRISTTNYSTNNISNKFAHLTNYSINKKNVNFQAASMSDKVSKQSSATTSTTTSTTSTCPSMDNITKSLHNTTINNSADEDVYQDIDENMIEEEEEEGDREKETFKWTLAAFKQWFSQQESPDKCQQVFSKIYDIVVQTFIAAESEITSSVYQHVAYRNNCFELFGCDLLVDKDLNVHLLEVNVSPSLMTNSDLDRVIKEQLIADVMHVVGVYPNDPSMHKYNEQIGSTKNSQSDMVYNPMAFTNLNKVLMTQDEYRRNPSPDNIDLLAISQVDSQLPPNPAGGQPSVYCPWWKMLIMIEDEMHRAQSTLFYCAHPHLSSIPTYLDINSLATKKHVPMSFETKFYLENVYAAARFADCLLYRWIVEGGSLGSAGKKYLPPAIKRELGIAMESSRVGRMPRSTSKGAIRPRSASATSTYPHSPALRSPRKGAVLSLDEGDDTMPAIEVKKIDSEQINKGIDREEGFKERVSSSPSSIRKHFHPSLNSNNSHQVPLPMAIVTNTYSVAGKKSDEKSRQAVEGNNETVKEITMYTDSNTYIARGSTVPTDPQIVTALKGNRIRFLQYLQQQRGADVKDARKMKESIRNMY